MSSGRVGSAFAEAGYDSLGNMIEAEPAAAPQPSAGDDGIRSVGYEEVSSYID